MQFPAGDILVDTTPVPVEGVDGRFTTVISDAWRILYAFGGATMATAIRAGEAAVARDDLQLITVDATFCAAMPCGPVAAHAEVIRQGRSGAQVLVRMWALDPQDPDPTGPERTDLVVVCVFGTATESLVNMIGTSAPDVPDPEDCPVREHDPESPFANIPYHHQTQFRPVGNWNWSEDRPPADPTTASWFRFNDPPLRADGTWEPATLALPGDILGPAVHAGAGSAVGMFLVVSLQIGMQFIAPAKGPWLLQHTHAHVAGGGYAAGTAALFDIERNTVAIATQSAKIQPFGS